MNRQKLMLSCTMVALGVWTGLMVASYFQPSDEILKVSFTPKDLSPQVMAGPIVELPSITQNISPIGQSETNIHQEDAESTRSQALLFRKHLIAKGETLSMISQKYYGTSKKWQEIYEANRDHLKNYDTIKPGTEIVIP